MTQTFANKSLRFTFELVNGQTFAGGGTKLQVAGLKATVQVRCAGMPSFPEVTARIYGMRQSDMNALVSLAFNPNQVFRNNVLIEADSGSGYVTIFAGQIFEASPDYSQAPATALSLHAQVMTFDLAQQATVTSFDGDPSVATVISGIAARMGYTFQNDGVEGVTLSGPYLSGTLADQLRAVAQAAGIDCFIEPGSSSFVNVVVITPKGSARTLPTYVLSPTSGMVGYPVRDSRGFITARAFFNPALRFGGPIQLRNTQLPNIPGQAIINADGNWVITALSHTLESVTPGGQWFSDIYCSLGGLAQPSST